MLTCTCDPQKCPRSQKISLTWLRNDLAHTTSVWAQRGYFTDIKLDRKHWQVNYPSNHWRDQAHSQQTSILISFEQNRHWVVGAAEASKNLKTSFEVGMQNLGLHSSKKQKNKIVSCLLLSNNGVYRFQKFPLHNATNHEVNNAARIGSE